MSRAALNADQVRRATAVFDLNAMARAFRSMEKHKRNGSRDRSSMVLAPNGHAVASDRLARVPHRLGLKYWDPGWRSIAPNAVAWLTPVGWSTVAITQTAAASTFQAVGRTNSSDRAP